MTGKEHPLIGSLRELPRDIEPPHDLWQGIEARLAAEPRTTPAMGATSAVGAASGSTASVASAKASWASRRPTLRWLAAAAMIATLAVGIWIGRSVMPFNGKPSGTMTASVPTGQPESLHAAYLMDARYTHEREQLVRSLEAKLATLPPDSRAKVVASLNTIHKSIQDLEAALGHDPTNALLQELLVNTYQDEMRVLTAVHEAGNAGKGI